jgi:hypothetical protein
LQALRIAVVLSFSDRPSSGAIYHCSQADLNEAAFRLEGQDIGFSQENLE